MKLTQSRSQSFVPLDQRSENASSGSNHYERTKEITEFWLSGSLRICIYGACLKWLLPELAFSDRWSRGTKLWERDWSWHQMHHVRRTCRTRACSMEKQTVARSGFSLVWRRRNHCSQGNFSVPYQRFVQADATFTPLENKVWLANARGNYWILYHKTNKEASTCAVFCCKALRKR